MRLLTHGERFDRILDIGCGTGDYVGVGVRHQGYYFGIDFSAAMIHEAKRKTADDTNPLAFVVGSGESLPYVADAFDLVLAIGFIEYFEDPSAALTEIRRVLKPGGVMIMQSYKRDLLTTVARLVKGPLRPIRRAVTGKSANRTGAWLDRQYSRRQLDRLVGLFGFTPIRHEFNNFRVLPPFLLARLPRLYTRLSEAITRSNPDLWSPLAANYIARYALDRALNV